MNPRFYPRDRRNSWLQNYFQDTADIIGIFWQFHKKRVLTGNIAFSLIGDEGFNINKVIKPDRQVDLINPFSGGTIISLHTSLQQFMLANMNAPISNESRFPIPASCNLLIDDYVKELIQRTKQKGAMYSGFASGE